MLAHVPRVLLTVASPHDGRAKDVSLECCTSSSLSRSLALQRMPLGDVSAIVWTAPLFTVCFGWACLKESLGRVELLAACSVVMGVIIVSRPSDLLAALDLADAATDAATDAAADATANMPMDGAAMDAGALALCVASSILTASTIVVIRKIAVWLHWTTLLLAHGIGQSTLSPLLAAALGVGFVSPSAPVLLSMLGCGLAAFVGQICVTNGMRMARAGPSSAMLTSEILVSFMLQSLAGRDAVRATSLGGALLIALSVATMMVAQKRGGAEEPLQRPPKAEVCGRDHHSDHLIGLRSADSAAAAAHDLEAVLEAETVVGQPSK